MISKPNDFKLGLFVLFGVLVLLAALFIFGASKWFEGKTVQETYFPETVDGLKVGAPVALRGVPVGQVTKINFTWNIYHYTEPRFVYVQFEVDRKVSLVPPGAEYKRFVQNEIKKGLRARVKSQGLAAGTAMLSLEYVNPAENPPLHFPWAPRNIYIPSAPGEMSQIMENLEKVLAEVKQIDFRKIGAEAQGDLAAAKDLIHHADEMNLREVGTNVNALVNDLRGVASQLHAFIGVTNQVPQAGLEQIARHADELVARLQGTVTRLDQSVGGVDVESLNQTLENLRRASRELDETISTIKEYPAGAIFGRPPPPARSVERPSQ